ncbi:hypothetical protein [Campylobacter estrildidarum]|uniref:Uncharacterized protein n=1 Tax=Campylobacter estrildidarum TaxID=2510189 RepID=A0A4U7BG42_9BACT|nr:hypothetical protein [Campylobacter estrildidarum]TKX28885.1 hypothetical protein CQA69_07705 [Campylobacter estrildidarum]
MLKESKLIIELKREYDEKLKKLRQKEKESKERIYKKLSSALLKDFEENKDFKIEFNLLIKKFNCKNTEKILEIINNLYDFNHKNNKIKTAKKQ